MAETPGLENTIDIARVIEKNSFRLSKAAVLAASKTLVDAAKKAVKGSVVKEVGRRAAIKGEKAFAKVGFVKFPRKDDGQDGPHGVYLELGTKYIDADHAVASAIVSNRNSAIESAKHAVKRELENLLNSK